MLHQQLGEWKTLESCAHATLQGFDLREAFTADKHRFDELSIEAPGMIGDLSKQLWTADIRQHLLALAEALKLPLWRSRLMAGDELNNTEGRSVDHVRWRRDTTAKLPTSLQKMLNMAERIRHNKEIDDIVHIGIGGSGLGPELVLQALADQASCRQRFHVVSNLDGHALKQTLNDLDATRTLFIVVSKSWSTTETLRNATSAAAWFRENSGGDMASRFIAVSARPERAHAFGAGTVLDMTDGMGGRFSIWSAVGLPVAIAIGAEAFKAFLAGAEEMDEHFAGAPSGRNLPLCMGLLDVWNTTFLGYAGRCVVPYHHGLRRLPAYLQQLEMESNGKRVNRDGLPLGYGTAGVTWGEEGSNCQHAFFQWLHQGTAPQPVELIGVVQAGHAFSGHHEALLANALAQAQALMLGARATDSQLPGHQDFPGNRPSTVLLLDRLDARTLGALLALYEHRVFVAGLIWGINSFDQWGVELGKSLARDLEPRLASGQLDGLDGSTAGLIRWIRR